MRSWRTKLKTAVREFVQEPATMPWGNRSLPFRDPDGNLVNFFTPLRADAVDRFEREALPPGWVVYVHGPSPGRHHE